MFFIKYKAFILFLVGFGLATIISVYKQNKIAGKANEQVSTANSIIQEFQKNKESIKYYQEQIENLRVSNNYERNQLQQQISGLKYELSNYQCPTQQVNRDGIYPSAPKKEFPGSFEITVESKKYYCRSR